MFTSSTATICSKSVPVSATEMSLSFATCSYKTINNAGKDFKIGSSLDKSGQNKLNKYLGSFKSLFVDELNEINVTNAGACYVKTKISTPISCQSNKLTRKQNEMLCEKVSELLRKGMDYAWISSD